MKELILRTATGIFLVVLFAGAILLGALPLLAIVLLIYILGTRELFKLISAEKGIPSALIALSGALLILGINAGLNPGPDMRTIGGLSRPALEWRIDPCAHYFPDFDLVRRRRGCC